mgnify:CR=1 FL=1
MRRLLPLPIMTLAAALAGCGVGEARTAVAEPEPAPLPVVAVDVAVTDLYASYHATSTLAADGEAGVRTRVAGEVVEILVEEGDPVVQGQLLARLDGERLRLEMLAAQARLAERRNEYQRQLTLAERGLISRAAFDSLQYEVDALSAAWEIARLDHAYTEIRAPITGVVSAREISVGEHLEARRLAFRISDTSRLVAELHVPQTELHRIRAGQSVVARVDAAGPAAVEATVARLSPTIDTDTGTFRVTSYIDNREGRFAPGMLARIDVRYEKYEKALALPAGAIIEEDGEHVVYLVRDGRAERRTVDLGARDRGLVQVTRGVAAGDRVIRDTGGVRDGTRVRAQDAGAGPAART